MGAVGEGFFSSSASHLIITGSVLWTRRIVLLCPGGGGLAMTSRRHRLKLRRSLSEQLRSSTSKAWDLLWRNVRERRVAGQYPAAGSPSPAGRVHSGGVGGSTTDREKVFLILMQLTQIIVLQQECVVFKENVEMHVRNGFTLSWNCRFSP